MEILINLVMLILLIGGIFTGVLSIMAFADMEGLRITRNKNIESGINLLVTSIIFFCLFIYSYCMSNLKNKNDEHEQRKVSVFRRSTINIKRLDQSQLSPLKDVVDPMNISINMDMNAIENNNQFISHNIKNSSQGEKKSEIANYSDNNLTKNEPEEEFEVFSKV